MPRVSPIKRTTTPRMPMRSNDEKSRAEKGAASLPLRGLDDAKSPGTAKSETAGAVKSQAGAHAANAHAMLQNDIAHNADITVNRKSAGSDSADGEAEKAALRSARSGTNKKAQTSQRTTAKPVPGSGENIRSAAKSGAVETLHGGNGTDEAGNSVSYGGTALKGNAPTTGDEAAERTVSSSDIHESERAKAVSVRTGKKLQNDIASGSARVGRVTLKDIARATGYTVNTVSHALNDKDDISAAAKAVIRRAAEELGYIGDSMAGSLRTGVTKTVAVIIGDVSNPHFAILVREIDAAAAEHGYCTVILNTDENPEKERSAIRTAVGRRVDGIIICPTQRDSGENTELLKRCGVPYCFVGRHDGGISNAVVTDDRMGGRLAAEKFLAVMENKELGAQCVCGEADGKNCESGGRHACFLYLGADGRISSESERRSGFFGALTAAGVPGGDLFECSADDMSGVAAAISAVMPKVLGRLSGGDFGAGASDGECASIGYIGERSPELYVLAFSDIYAFEAKRCFEELGFGGAVVMGFDNIRRTLPFLPDIASVEASESLGAAAFDLFLSLLSSPPSPPKLVVIPTKVSG